MEQKKFDFVPLEEYNKAVEENRKLQAQISKKMEFSKKWLIGCISVSILFTSFSYVLALMDKNPVQELSIAINQLLWGTSGISFIGYTIQNFMRAYSKNKYLTTQEVQQNVEQQGY